MNKYLLSVFKEIKKRITFLKFFIYGFEISRYFFYRLLLGKNIKSVFVETKQGNFLLNPYDFHVSRSLINQGAYAPEEIKLILSLKTKRSRILFVGAHIGALVIPISKTVRDITAIEANPDTFKLLISNLALNHVKNTTAIQIAANDKKGNILFLKNILNSGGSKREPFLNHIDYKYEKPEVVNIKSDRLDNVLKPIFDIIFMDIEGSEYFALKGMPMILRNANFLIIEFIPHHLRLVSAVNITQFVATLSPHFDYLYIPSKKLKARKEFFGGLLQEMFSNDESDPGIVFSKKDYFKARIYKS